MRYRRIFDIIEVLRRFIIELQIKLLWKYFENWVLKLLSCIAWRLNNVLMNKLNPLSTAVSLFLFYLLDFDLPEHVFLKKHSRAPLLKHKKKTKNNFKQHVKLLIFFKIFITKNLYNNKRTIKKHVLHN